MLPQDPTTPTRCITLYAQAANAVGEPDKPTQLPDDARAPRHTHTRATLRSLHAPREVLPAGRKDPQLLVLFRTCREARLKPKKCPAYAAKPDTYLKSPRTHHEVPTKPDRISRTSHRPTMTAGHFAPDAKSRYRPLHYARTPRNPKAITGPLRACRGVPVEPEQHLSYVARADST